MDDRRARTRPRSDPPRGPSTLAETFGDAPSAAPDSPSARRGLGRRRRRHGSDPHTAARHASGVRVSASCSRDTRNTRAGSQRGDQPLRPTVRGTRSNGRDGATSPGAPPRRHASSAPTGAQAHGRHRAVQALGVRLGQHRPLSRRRPPPRDRFPPRALGGDALEWRRRDECWLDGWRLDGWGDGWRLDGWRLDGWRLDVKQPSTGLRAERNPWTRSLPELMTPLRKSSPMTPTPDPPSEQLRGVRRVVRCPRRHLVRGDVDLWVADPKSVDRRGQAEPAVDRGVCSGVGDRSSRRHVGDESSGSSDPVRVSAIGNGESITWPHRRFGRNCLASVTPQLTPATLTATVRDGAIQPGRGNLDREGVRSRQARTPNLRLRDGRLSVRAPGEVARGLNPTPGLAHHDDRRNAAGRALRQSQGRPHRHSWFESARFG